MNEDIREIEYINFGVFSEEEILKVSVAKIENTKLNGHGSVYDERMGVVSPQNPDAKCITCSLNQKDCPGHFGHIEFVEPIIHPKYYRVVISFLQCFCLKCNAMLITNDQVLLEGLNKYKRNIRFEKIVERMKKVDICIHCSNIQPKIIFDTKENTISLSYKQGKEQPPIIIPLSVNEILKLFETVTNGNVETLGFNPKLIHPKNLVIQSLLVLPPCARPPVISSEGNISDDDLTLQYIEIIKCNHSLQTLVENPEEAKQTKLIQCLKFRVASLFDNSQGKAKHSTNQKVIKGLKERLSGKEGQIRNNLMGKRCEQTARTVIGPDPTLRMGQLAVPFEIAENLTIPETVTAFNKDFLLNEIVWKGKANFVIKKGKKNRINLKYALVNPGTELKYGDIITRDGKQCLFLGQPNFVLRPNDQVERNGEKINLEFPNPKPFDLEIGDVVERQLRNGDYILLNRQPTLHKGSMMAQQIVLRPCKTLRFNLSINKSFNADFDGDEMNIHVPQTYEARAELASISATKFNMISPQSSKPNIVIVQDSLLAAYLMTKSKDKIDKEDFFNIAGHGINVNGSYWSPDFILKKLRHMERVFKRFKKNLAFTGKALFSLLLPVDFNYESKNNVLPEEPIVKIFQGVLYEGAINKTDLGGSYNSIIQLLHKEYNKDVASTFVDNVQFITHQWFTMTGITVGIKDCIPRQIEDIYTAVEKCMIEAKTIENTTYNPGIREVRVTAALNKARDIGLRIAKNALEEDNNFISTVTSGSKGDYFNITQITGLLGQQNLVGQRVPKHLNHGKRTLPHYPFEGMTEEREYESRGFIKHSFIHGLNPMEFFFHAMSGREGITDTAMGTSRSGYIQRRIIKVTEDIQVKYDGTVRNTEGNVYQFAYGEDGIDPTAAVMKKGDMEICDIDRIVDCLNMKAELKK